MRWLQNTYVAKLLISERDEENKRNDLRRNSITAKIILRQFDEVAAENQQL